MGETGHSGRAGRTATDARLAFLSSFGRAVFAATLLPWFWLSAVSRFAGSSLSMGPTVEGTFLSLGAFYAYLPGTAAQSLTGTPEFTLAERAYVAGMSLAELVLPVLIVIGLAARWAAAALILHQAVAAALAVPAAGAGALFDASPFEMMPDQILLWSALLAPVILAGAGPLSVDAGLRRLWRQARA